MISERIYRRVRNGVCAVGYLTGTLEQYLKHSEAGMFQVIGTGFLIGSATVLTNRHVIAGLLKAEITQVIPRRQLFIQFVAPNGRRLLQIVPRMIREVSYLDDPKLDIGFIKYKVVHRGHFRSIRPLAIVDRWNLRVSEEVGVCGYPYGTQLLASGHSYRWGPVVQQGHISAVSPFDTTGKPDDILLDVRTAGGMSGAPVFRPRTGTVIGVHYAGIEATTAFGVPLNQSTVKAALAKFNKRRIVLNGP